MDNLDAGIPAPGRLLRSQPCSGYFPVIYCNPNGAAEGNWQGWDGGGEGLVTLGVTERLTPTGSPTGAGFQSSGIGCAAPGGGGNDNKLNNNIKLPAFPAIPGALFLVQIPWRRGWFAFTFRRILNPGICWLFFFRTPSWMGSLLVESFPAHSRDLQSSKAAYSGPAFSWELIWRIPRLWCGTVPSHIHVWRNDAPAGRTAQNSLSLIFPGHSCTNSTDPSRGE